MITIQPKYNIFCDCFLCGYCWLLQVAIHSSSSLILSSQRRSWVVSVSWTRLAVPDQRRCPSEPCLLETTSRRFRQCLPMHWCPATTTHFSVLCSSINVFAKFCVVFVPRVCVCVCVWVRERERERDKWGGGEGDREELEWFWVIFWSRDHPSLTLYTQVMSRSVIANSSRSAMQWQ